MRSFFSLFSTGKEFSVSLTTFTAPFPIFFPFSVEEFAFFFPRGGLPLFFPRVALCVQSSLVGSGVVFLLLYPCGSFIDLFPLKPCGGSLFSLESLAIYVFSSYLFFQASAAKKSGFAGLPQ